MTALTPTRASSRPGSIASRTPSRVTAGLGQFISPVRQAGDVPIDPELLALDIQGSEADAEGSDEDAEGEAEAVEDDLGIDAGSRVCPISMSVGIEVRLMKNRKRV